MVTHSLSGVGALIYCTSTRRYLFLLRDNASYSNTWGIVGGKIEAGECIMDALAREMQEEIGSIEVQRVTPVEKFTSDNRRFVYHTLLVSVEKEFVPVLNREHSGYCWATLEDHPAPLHPGVWKTIGYDEVLAKIRTFECLNH
jgi:8-oxo-dGTP pyrophosphatase MutT (NUDIX family)